MAICDFLVLLAYALVELCIPLTQRPLNPQEPPSSPTVCFSLQFLQGSRCPQSPDHVEKG